MQITLQVPDEICREAADRKLAVIDFVEMLIDKGLIALHSNVTVSTAIERIRALHSAAPDSKL
jgi:hypothetical protein